MFETSSVHPRKSSEIFANLRKISETVRKRSPYLRNNFGESSEIFGKWSEIFGKSSKTSSLVCLCNKQNITCSLVDMNFIFSCSSRHLTRSLRSLVRYRVEHSKIKFISTRGHVISSIYLSGLHLKKNNKNAVSIKVISFRDYIKLEPRPDWSSVRLFKFKFSDEHLQPSHLVTLPRKQERIVMECDWFLVIDSFLKLSPCVCLFVCLFFRFRFKMKSDTVKPE